MQKNTKKRKNQSGILFGFIPFWLGWEMFFFCQVRTDLTALRALAHFVFDGISRSGEHSGTAAPSWSGGCYPELPGGGSGSDGRDDGGASLLFSNT